MKNSDSTLRNPISPKNPNLGLCDVVNCPILGTAATKHPRIMVMLERDLRW